MRSKDELKFQLDLRKKGATDFIIHFLKPTWDTQIIGIIPSKHMGKLEYYLSVPLPYD